MSQTAIPLGFEQYLQNKVSLGEPTDLNEIIFAYIPDLDVSQPIDRTVTLPPQGQWVHQQDVDQIGRSGNNAVVYTVVIPGSTAPFTFNALFLRDKAVPNSCAMVVYKATETKETGMALTKSMLTQFDGAAQSANVTVDASTWQIDYNARLKGMDEDHRLHCLDNYGHTAILDGFVVTQHAADTTKYLVSPGVAYLGGLRVHSTQLQVHTITQRPTTLWLDAFRDGTALSPWANTVQVIATTDTLTDYTDDDGRQHYVCPLGTLNSDDSIEDLREVWGADTSGPQDCPTGVPLPWPTDVAPEGFAIMKGQAFDIETFTKTANAYPSGILPDMRGMTVKGVKDDETVLGYEADGVLAHDHPLSIDATDLGTKYTNTAGHHAHTQVIYRGNDLNWSSSFGGPYPVGTDDQSGAHRTGRIDGAGNHNHYTVMGAHGHTGTALSVGEEENTVKNIKFNWIVRLL
ncbi:phage tail protein [Enterovibrio sp. Hal110]